MKKINVLFLFFLFSPAMVANEPEKPDDAPAMTGAISGKVTDAQTRIPVEYATVGIYNVSDSSLVTGTISDSDGNFLVAGLPYGQYFMEVSFVGYQDTRIEQVKVNNESRMVEFSGIVLKQASETLEAVEVVSRQQAVEYRIDRKVINVARDVTSTGGTAVDVLENTASVQTDIDGNVSLRGSSNFTVLIDGRPGILEGSDALQQIPAGSIQRIEIITNPSARYDPDGTSGIINVVMKKERRNGLNGMINASAETLGEYSFDAILNYRTGKFNVFGGVEYNRRPSPGKSETRNTTLVNDTSYFFESSGDREWLRGGQVLRGGLEYFINDRNTLTLSGSFGDRRFGIGSNSRFREFTLPETEEIFYTQDNNFSVRNNYYSADLNYRLNLEGEGHELTAYAYFSSNAGDDRQEIFTQFTDAFYNPLEVLTGKQRSRENSTQEQYRFNIDYVRPLGGSGRIETGIQAQFNMGQADYFMEEFDPDLLLWSRMEGFASRTDFHRNIQSIYAMYYGEVRNWFDYQFGLRTEYTDRLIRSLMAEEEFPVYRLDFYPSVFISRKLPSEQQVQASYSRRVDRPRSWYLDPFPRFEDPQNLRIGNPALEPEFIDSWELNYQNRLGEHTLSVETYFRQTNNKITRIRELREDNVMVESFENLNRDQALGMELMGSFILTGWWDLMASSNVYHYRVTRLEQDGGGFRSTNTFSIRTNSNIMLKRTGTRIQMTGLYNGPSVDAQGSREGWWMANLGIRQDLLKNSLSITFRLSDIFRTMKWASVTEGVNFTSEREYIRQSPVFGLSVSYKINNYRQSRQDNRGGDMDFGGGGMEF